MTVTQVPSDCTCLQTLPLRQLLLLMIHGTTSLNAELATCPKPLPPRLLLLLLQQEYKAPSLNNQKTRASDAPDTSDDEALHQSKARKLRQRAQSLIRPKGKGTIKLALALSLHNKQRNEKLRRMAKFPICRKRSARWKLVLA